MKRTCNCISAGHGLNDGEALFDIVCKNCPINKDFCVHFVATEKSNFIIETCEFYIDNSVDFSSKSIECNQKQRRR